jgi:hypothetical protein
MALYTVIIPFIHTAEGKLDSDPTDAAASHPCPYSFFGRNGIHTSSGYTWEIFSKEFGSTPDTATRFFMMSDPNKPNTADWNYLFKLIYWDTIKGDLINSQELANSIVDMCFNSGQHEASIIIQRCVMTPTDGIIGQHTVDAINGFPDQHQLYLNYQAGRCSYYHDLVENNPKYQVDLVGWLNRVENLNQFNALNNVHV